MKSRCSCRRTKAGRHAGRLLTAEPNICRAGSAVRRDFGVRKRHSVPISGRCQMPLKRWDSCCTLRRRGLLSLDFSLFGTASVSVLPRTAAGFTCFCNSFRAEARSILPRAHGRLPNLCKGAPSSVHASPLSSFPVPSVSDRIPRAPGRQAENAGSARFLRNTRCARIPAFRNRLPEPEEAQTALPFHRMLPHPAPAT